MEIKHKDFGRIKRRGIILTYDHTEIEMALEILMTDKL